MNELQQSFCRMRVLYFMAHSLFLPRRLGALYFSYLGLKCQRKVIYHKDHKAGIPILKHPQSHLETMWSYKKRKAESQNLIKRQNF